jgi:cyclopropane fatty-acyl-phospholipid synthase-like methyltransferase
MFNISQHFKHLDLAPGMVAADLGCGVGATTLQLAKAFPQNIVCGVDIDRNALDRLEANMNAEKEEVSKRVKILQADLEDEKTTPIPENTFDAAIVENLFHTLTHRKAFVWNLKMMLKDGAKVLVTDLHTSPLKTAQHQGMLVDQKDVERLFVEAGFLVYPIEDSRDAHSYTFLAKKPDGRRININHT